MTSPTQPGQYSQWLPNPTHMRRVDLFPDPSKINNRLRDKLDYNMMAFILQTFDPYYTPSRLRSLTPNDIVFAYTTMFPDS